MVQANLEPAEAPLLLARVTFHVQQEREPSLALNRTRLLMKPFAQLALLASTLLLGTIHAQTALRVDLEQDQPINAQVLVRLAPTQSLGQQPANSVQLENTAQQRDLLPAAALAMFHVLVESMHCLVRLQICGQIQLCAQAAQQVHLPQQAPILAPLVFLVHGQPLGQQVAHLVLLVVTALVLQINAQDLALPLCMELEQLISVPAHACQDGTVLEIRTNALVHALLEDTELDLLRNVLMHVQLVLIL